MRTFSAQPPCTRRLRGEWRFVFTAEAQRSRGCAEETVTITHVLINYLIQHVNYNNQLWRIIIQEGTL